MDVEILYVQKRKRNLGPLLLLLRPLHVQATGYPICRCPTNKRVNRTRASVRGACCVGFPEVFAGPNFDWKASMWQEPMLATGVAARLIGPLDDGENLLSAFLGRCASHSLTQEKQPRCLEVHTHFQNRRPAKAGALPACSAKTPNHE